MKTDSGKKLDIDSYMVKELAPFQNHFPEHFLYKHDCYVVHICIFVNSFVMF